MLDGGADPLYVGRRMVRMAVEDIGLADPRALRVALDACETYERLGSPEGELALAEAVIYLAVAAKSNAVYDAYNAARAFVSQDAHAAGADAPAQRADQADEGPRLRQGLPLRARRARRLRRRARPTFPRACSRPSGTSRPSAGWKRRSGEKLERAEEQEMIDIQLLRKDPEGVAKRLATRGAGAFDAALFQRSKPRARSCRPRSSRRRPRATSIAKEIGRRRRKGEDVAPLLEQGEKLKALLEKSGAEARRRCRREIAGFPRAHAEPAARVGAGRRLVGGQPRGAALGHAARVRLSRRRITSTSARRSAGSISPPAPRSPAAASW